MSNYTSEVLPNAELKNNILSAIRKIDNRSKTVKFITFNVLSLSSLVSSVFAFIYVYEKFTETGFFSYFSLIFSDFSITMSYWKTFSMSLVEALPLFSVAVFLTVVLVLIWSIIKTFNNIPNALTKKFA